MSKCSIKRMVKKIAAASVAAVMTLTALPIESIAAYNEQANNNYNFDDY